MGVQRASGGGTLITFPALVATGMSVKAANITNTVALCPGYFGGTYAQRKDLEAQRHRRPLFAVAAGLGGLTGSLLLLATSDAVFKKIIPFLILGAVTLLLFQDKLRPKSAADAHEARRPGPRELVPIYAVAIYGGYFGAGLGIMTLAVLGVLIDDLFTRINALKQAVSFVVNTCAASSFFSGKVNGRWEVMAVAALVWETRRTLTAVYRPRSCPVVMSRFEWASSTGTSVLLKREEPVDRVDRRAGEAMRSQPGRCVTSVGQTIAGTTRHRGSTRG